MLFKKEISLLISAGLCIYGKAWADTTNLPQRQVSIQQLNQEISELQQQVHLLLQQQKAKSTATVIKSVAPSSVPPLGRPIYSSPLLVTSSAYDASDLIVQLPPINEDLSLLQLRQKMAQQLGADNLPSLTQPLVILGGKIEGQELLQHSYSGDSATNFNLSAVELDVLAQASPWVYGFMAITYNNAPFDSSLAGSGNAVNNSQIVLDRGFVTLGNLDKLPFYASLGQMYVPFGEYMAAIISNPVTKALGGTKARAALFGFAQNGWSISTYAFNGATEPQNNSTLANWGANADYTFHQEIYHGDLGVGYISNLAESLGAQNNGDSSGSFQGFSQSSLTENLAHKVPGFDAHAALSAGPFTVNGEWVAALTAYDQQDMTFNGSGAQPQALHVEMDYGFHILGKPSNLALAYEQTWQALAMNLPKNSYLAVLSTSMWKNTVQMLEFRHDVNYPGTDTAGGRCSDPSNPNVTFCSVTVPGKTQNALLFQVGVYF